MTRRFHVAAALLAAGASSRLGRPKQLVSMYGTPLVRVLAEEIACAGCSDTAVVLGAREAAIRPCLDNLAVEVLSNRGWQEGMASSIRVATSWAAARGATALLLATVDQAFLTATHVDALIEAYRRDSGIVASRYAGICGIPAIFDSSMFTSLLALTGSEGAKHILRGAPNVTALDWANGAFDVDTPRDAKVVETYGAILSGPHASLSSF
jgi:molybdenum cofactor cytidylyltransferase